MTSSLVYWVGLREDIAKLIFRASIMEWPSILKIPDYNPPKSLIMRARLKRKVSYIWTGDQFWRLGHMEEKVEEDILEFSSVQFSRSVLSNSLRPHGLQHARLPCSSPTPRAYSNSCPSSRWCHLTISSSVVPFSSCLQPFPASGFFFPMSWHFASGGQSIGASASVLPMNVNGWFLF